MWKVNENESNRKILVMFEGTYTAVITRWRHGKNRYQVHLTPPPKENKIPNSAQLRELANNHFNIK